MLQHGSYTLLIDSCYDREEFPTLEQAIDWTWASTTEEIEAVKFVLGRFFELIDGVYVQPRIKEELDAYHEKAEKNKRIAIERETKRKESSTKRVRVVNEPPPNQEPRTKNQEPIKEKREKRKSFSPPSVDEVRRYCESRGSTVDPDRFVDFYTAKNWLIGKSKMKDWQAAVRTWETRKNETHSNDTRSRAKRVSDKLDEIARRDIEQNGLAQSVG